MTPVAAESPLRKSDSRVFRTPQPVLQANDDEAERSIRRSEARSLDESTIVGGNTVESNENIKMCLKLFSDNKLSKDNAWSVSIIDTFAKLVARHSNTLQNFQVAGSTLEASAKVYGLRVDSVHTDVMRMCSELTRQSARAMDNNAEVDDDDDDRGGGDLDSGTAAEGGEGSDMNKTKAPVKKQKRVRKHVSQITKNKESINAPLETIPFTDPFFAKLNSVVGDVNSSNRLMQNIIPTKQAQLQLSMDNKFWDNNDPPVLDYNYKWSNVPPSEIRILENFPKNISGLKFHTILADYKITDAPAEFDETDDVHHQNLREANGDDHQEHDAHFDNSQLAVQFDINADVEPIPTGDAHIIDYQQPQYMDIGFAGEGAADDDDHLNEEDLQALQACRGLKRQTMVLEDMRPVDHSILEYSYRPLDIIDQFWAGPSHWKFKRSKPRSTLRSSVATGTTGASGAGEQVKGARQVRRKKRFETDTIDDALSLNESRFRIVNESRPLKSITYQKQTILKKWDNKKLKLPTDLNLERNRYDVFHLAPGLRTKESTSDAEPNVPASDYDYNNPTDQAYCPRIPVEGETDTETETDAQTGDNDPGVGGDMGDMGDDDHQNYESGFPTDPNDVQPAANQTVDFISTEFQGAPDKVAKIIIPYAKTAKVVDMKQLKTSCWRLINEKSIISDTSRESQQPPPDVAAGAKVLNFNKLYKDLPSQLSKTMSENISTSLAFYSVLHLANEKSLRLEQMTDLEDFKIYLPPNER
uniref:Condensin complex subunit 2 n=1 Tax=Corethrella appendiculata TaxID=1370023 RepID=U5EZU8_9DIPT